MNGYNRVSNHRFEFQLQIHPKISNIPNNSPTEWIEIEMDDWNRLVCPWIQRGLILGPQGQFCGYNTLFRCRRCTIERDVRKKTKIVLICFLYTPKTWSFHFFHVFMPRDLPIDVRRGGVHGSLLVSFTRLPVYYDCVSPSGVFCEGVKEKRAGRGDRELGNYSWAALLKMGFFWYV